MRKFTEMRFFHILDSVSRSGTDLPLLKNAYNEFANSLFTESEHAHNLTAYYNRLCYTRIELQGLRKNKLFKDKDQQTPIKGYCDKALKLLDTQLKLVEIKIKTNKKNQTAQEKPNKVNRGIKWSGTIIELVELGYATLESKSFNNGDVEIKELIQFLCDMFDFEVKDCYRVFVDIRHRSGDRTIYLDRLKEKLIEKMERMDNRDR